MTETGNIEQSARIGAMYGGEANAALALQMPGDSATVGLASTFEGMLSALIPGSGGDEAANAGKESLTPRFEAHHRDENGFLSRRAAANVEERQPATESPAHGREVTMRERPKAPDTAGTEPAVNDPPYNDQPMQTGEVDAGPQESAVEPMASEAQNAADQAPVSQPAAGGDVLLSADVTQVPLGTGMSAENADASATGNTATDAAAQQPPGQAAVLTPDAQTVEFKGDGVPGLQTLPLQESPGADTTVIMRQAQQAASQAGANAATDGALTAQTGGETGAQTQAEQTQTASASAASNLVAPEAQPQVEVAPEAGLLSAAKDAAPVVLASSGTGADEQPVRPYGQDAATSSFGVIGAQKTTADTGAKTDGGTLSNNTAGEGRDSGAARSTASVGTVSEGTNFASKLSKTETGARANQAETIEKIVRSIRVAVERGESRVRILLEPPRLGSVRIQMAIKDGVLNASFETQTPAARHVITQNLAHLRAALEEQGIEVGEFSVSVEGENDSRQLSEESERYEMGPAGGLGLFAGSEDEDDEYDIFAEQRRLTASASVLDMFV
ncbi:MAG: flagellar hook-length control protein FliK [Planctomycetota bacterium]